jgi:hypothetical protein
VLLVGDRERDAAARSLRRHYVGGRLTVEELSARLDLVVRARSRRDLLAAVGDLPPRWLDAAELGRTARGIRRALALALLTIGWLMLSLGLLVAFALTAIAHGVTTADAIAFPVAWLVGTAVLWRAGRRA